MSDAVDAHAPYNKDEKDNEREIDTFPEAFENIVRIAHDARQWGRLFLGAWAIYFVFFVQLKWFILF
jgi:hypothetical protein